jgi:hypothetical protein
MEFGSKVRIRIHSHGILFQDDAYLKGHEVLVGAATKLNDFTTMPPRAFIGIRRQ